MLRGTDGGMTGIAGTGVTIPLEFSSGAESVSISEVSLSISSDMRDIFLLLIRSDLRSWSIRLLYSCSRAYHSSCTIIPGGTTIVIYSLGNTNGLT